MGRGSRTLTFPGPFGPESERHDVLFKPRRTLASDAFTAVNAFKCLRFIRICGHNLVVRSDIANIHSADAYDHH